MIKKYIQVLDNCQLFKNISSDEIISICQEINCCFKEYHKHDLIFDEGDPCKDLSIILSGKLELHTFFISGDVSNLITLNPGQIFGEAILFSDKDEYPISVSALQDTLVLQLSKKDMLKIMDQHQQFLENYLKLLSSKLLFLNDKFKLLSLSTIRGKIAHVLIKLSKEQKSMKVKLPFSKEKMALHICTRRPSLSRELSKMKKEGLIDYDKSLVTIIDYDALVDELF